MWELELWLSKDVKEAIDWRHMWNARWCLVDISNKTQKLLFSELDDAEIEKEMRQMEYDKKAIEEFFDRERNIKPKEPIDFNYKKYM